jgi:signal transduction histidine kinase/PAS domain-containing protein
MTTLDAPVTATTSTHPERTATLYRFLCEAIALIARSEVPEPLYLKLCELATHLHPDIVLAWIGLRQTDSLQVRVAAKSGRALAYVDHIDVIFDPAHPEKDGPTARAMREHRCVFSNDFLRDPLTEPWHERARQAGIAASATIPFGRDGEAYGALMFYSSVPNLFDVDLREMFGVLGQALSQAIYAIAEHQKRDAALREIEISRINLQAIFDASEETIVMFEADHRVIAINQIGAERFGCIPQDLVGTDVFDQMPVEIAAYRRGKIDEALRSGTTVVYEDERNGRSYRTRVFPVPGQPQRAVVYAVDITAQRRNIRRIEALLDIALTEQSVDEQTFLNRGLTLAEQVTDSQIGFLHFVNDDQETIQLVTWTASTLKDCSVTLENHYPISQAGIWADCVHQMRPVVFNDYTNYVAKHTLPAGHAGLTRLISVPVIEGAKVRMVIGVGNKTMAYHDADIETVQLIGSALWRAVSRERAERELLDNLADQRELNRKLEEAHNQLLQSEKMASIGQLAAGVAHELNNPIGFVYSNLGTLQAYLKDIFEINDACDIAAATASNPADFARINALKTQKDFDYLKSDIFSLMNESRDGLSRVTKIVQDLKDFSRAGEIDWQWADLHKGLDSTLNIVWNELKYKCTVEKHYDPALPMVRCMPSQLNQVFMNLLINAAQAIETQGKITIRTRPLDAEHIELSFSDTGKGIPSDNLRHIFEPFFTTKPVGQGTGLGLSIAYGIIGKHQGTIQVGSTPGQGTTFTITLPVNPAENHESKSS